MKTVPRVATAAALALLASGCAGDSRAGTTGASTPPGTSTPPGASSPPGRAGALVLRTMTTGGIAGFGGPGALPDFSLYADGTAIAGARRPMEYHLTRRALQGLVSAASDAGLARPRTVTDPKVADAMYKQITFVTGGRARTTKVMVPGGADPAERFLRRLDPATWPKSDLTGPARPYRPARVAALAVSSAGTGPSWPFEPLASGTHVGTRTCTVLSGADAAKATRHGQWRDRGQTFTVTLRPLLPDETDCAALAR